MSRRQLRLQHAARRRILGALAVTTACSAWLLASGWAGSIAS